MKLFYLKQLVRSHVQKQQPKQRQRVANVINECDVGVPKTNQLLIQIHGAVCMLLPCQKKYYAYPSA